MTNRTSTHPAYRLLPFLLLVVSSLLYGSCWGPYKYELTSDDKLETVVSGMHDIQATDWRQEMDWLTRDAIQAEWEAEVAEMTVEAWETGKAAWEEERAQGAQGFSSDTSAPLTNECSIKGNIQVDTGERIYHLPGCEYYSQTVIDTNYGERWFCSEEEARAAGWRKAYNCP